VSTISDSSAVHARWRETPAEKVLVKFPDALVNITPKNPKWLERVKIEVLNIMKYLDFLKQKGGRKWFFLAPSRDPRYNYKKWDGYLQVATRPEIKFKMVILLPSNYPYACPRAFIEERIVEYTGKIYTKNIWTEENGEKYLMICHDHMAEIDGIWTPNLTIAHFFIREVFYWWAAQQNLIIDEWDKKHNKNST